MAGGRLHGCLAVGTWVSASKVLHEALGKRAPEGTVAMALTQVTTQILDGFVCRRMSFNCNERANLQGSWQVSKGVSECLGMAFLFGRAAG